MSASVGSRRAGSKAWGGWAAVAVVVLLSATCNTAGTVTDERDGQTYRTVKIGNKTWMAENLNFKTERSVCYDDADSNCTKYGRLYTWDDAMKACPAGWHLPSDAEWNSLVVAVGGVRDEYDNWKGAGKKLKSKSGWKDNGNGTDDYGFSALPGGYGWDGGFGNAGINGDWWSATEYDADFARYQSMYYNLEDVYWNGYDKDSRFSSRCLED